MAGKDDHWPGLRADIHKYLELFAEKDADAGRLIENGMRAFNSEPQKES